MSIQALLKCRPFSYLRRETYTHAFDKIVQCFYAEWHYFMALANSVPLLEIGGTQPLAAGTQWRVIPGRDIKDVLATLASGVGLVLVHAGAEAASVIAAIRTSGLAAAAVPIAVLGGTLRSTTLGDTRASDPSDVLPDLHIADDAADDIPAMLAGWLPASLPDAFHRVEATFGADTVRGMALRLCTVLGEALDALGTPTAADAAHKVAGVAGTLGFGDLGQQWLAVSHDPAAEPTTLRRQTRTTIAAIVLHTTAG